MSMDLDSASAQIVTYEHDIAAQKRKHKHDCKALRKERGVCKIKSVNHCEYRTQKPSDLVELISTYKEDFSDGKTIA